MFEPMNKSCRYELLINFSQFSSVLVRVSDSKIGTHIGKGAGKSFVDAYIFLSSNPPWDFIMLASRDIWLKLAHSMLRAANFSPSTASCSDLRHFLDKIITWQLAGNWNARGIFGADCGSIRALSFSFCLPWLPPKKTTWSSGTCVPSFWGRDIGGATCEEEFGGDSEKRKRKRKTRIREATKGMTNEVVEVAKEEEGDKEIVVKANLIFFRLELRFP